MTLTPLFQCADAAFSIHSLWGSPCLIIVILVLLYQQVGWATFVGLGVMLLLVPVTGILVTKLAAFRKELLEWTDKRVGLMSEVISGIQMIKFMAWEVPFTQEAMGYRQNEARIMRNTAMWQGIFALTLFIGPILVAVFCFGSYSLAGNVLSPASAYAALSFFSLLRFPMSFLPMMISMWVNALVALARIQGFLLRTEAKLEQEATEEGVALGLVRIEGGNFVWEEEAVATEEEVKKKKEEEAKNKKEEAKEEKEEEVKEEEEVKKEKKPVGMLKSIDLDATPGTLTMVVGSVGSGKSSLLSALIGHMSRQSGTVTVGGRISYVAQTAWVMNDTLQENILMGCEMDGDKYAKCLQVAQVSLRAL